MRFGVTYQVLEDGRRVDYAGTVEADTWDEAEALCAGLPWRVTGIVIDPAECDCDDEVDIEGEEWKRGT